MNFSDVDNEFELGNNSDISVTTFLNSISANYNIGKAIELLVKGKANPTDPEDFTGLVSAIYYILAELENEFPHCKDEWSKANVFEYVKLLGASNPPTGKDEN